MDAQQVHAGAGMVTGRASVIVAAGIALMAAVAWASVGNGDVPF